MAKTGIKAAKIKLELNMEAGTAAAGLLVVALAVLEVVVVVTWVVVVVSDVLPVVEVGPSDVDEAAIWDLMSGLNWPVMPVRVNLAEKARYGMAGLVGSGMVESARIKY